MSKPSNNSPAPPHNTHSTLTGNFISLCLQIILFVLLAWFCLILWFAGLSLVKGGDAAYSQAKQLLFYQQSVFQAMTPDWQWLTTYSPDTIVHRWLIQTHVIDKLNILAQKLSLRDYAVSLVGDTYFACLPVIMLLIVTDVVLSRLYLFILALPLFFWCLLPAAIDGLAQRDIRKFQVMRESTFFFHRMKRILPIVFYVPLFGFFVCPLAFNALWFLVPMVLMVSIIFFFSLQQFKKYL